MRLTKIIWLAALAVTGLWAAPAAADPFHFSTGTVLTDIAIATRPSTGAKFEIEAGDDFITTAPTRITSATFTGLLTNPSFTGGISPANINSVIVEIYRVFPNDSNVGRTSGPPAFGTPQVPTRVNSPSDVEFADRSSSDGNLTFTATVLSASLTAKNSILPGGIHSLLDGGPLTGGNGPVTGTEVQLNVTFSTPFDLPPDHFFFVPQVDVTGGEFLWLNASRPIDATGTPFAPDLQSWTRDQFLQPDWLRAGTDIVGGTTFNAAFSLDGVVIPEPTTLGLVGVGLAGLAVARRRSRGRRSGGPGQ
jgi:hypothetical protein